MLKKLFKRLRTNNKRKYFYENVSLLNTDMFECNIDALELGLKYFPIDDAGYVQDKLRVSKDAIKYFIERYNRISTNNCIDLVEVSSENYRIQSSMNEASSLEKYISDNMTEDTSLDELLKMVGIHDLRLLEDCNNQKAAKARLIHEITSLITLFKLIDKIDM